jgi:hypothetical protein
MLTASSIKKGMLYVLDWNTEDSPFLILTVKKDDRSSNLVGVTYLRYGIMREITLRNDSPVFWTKIQFSSRKKK